MCFRPGFCFGAVGARAPDVHEDDGEEEGQDVHFQLEVGGRGALPHAVPCCVGPRGEGAGLLGEVCGVGEGGDGGGGGVGRAGVVGEVWGGC